MADVILTGEEYWQLRTVGLENTLAIRDAELAASRNEVAALRAKDNVVRTELKKRAKVQALGEKYGFDPLVPTFSCVDETRTLTIPDPAPQPAKKGSRTR